MKTTIFGVFLSTISFVAQPVFADQLKSEILKCANTKDGVNRFSCYENIGKALLAAEQKNTGSAPSTSNEIPSQSSRLNNTASVKASTAESKPEEIVLTELPAELGGKHFNNTSDGTERRREPSARGKVTSCKKAVNGKWFFIFDNGQVWKQVGSSRRNYRECNFLATIERDRIGFKMTVDGEKRDLRIRRHR